MQQKTFAIALLLILCKSLLLAQSKFTVSGTVKQRSSGESLIGVTVVIVERPNIGVTTNEYGFYSISLPQGNYTVRFSYVGYKQELVPVQLNADVKINAQLSDESKLQEVVVKAKREDDNLTSASMGTEVLNIKAAAKLPVVFGEKDLVKTIQLMPGVKSNGEGSNGFSVRGGSTDQNLILLDEAPVYNASHMLGIFSTFNSDAIKDATIIKGNNPAQYGGRLSSVLDVKMKEGNNRQYHASGGIGLISSRLTLEGPIQKDKSSFIISGRRTYADLFAKISPDFRDIQLYFYDFNAKANLAINDRNKLYFSGYFGKDVLGVSKTFGSKWGNATGTLRWNSVLNSKLFSNTSFIYSNYDFNVGFKSDNSETNFNSHIRDLNMKQDFTWYASNRHTVRFGFNAIHHTITPTTASGTDIVSDKKSQKGWENAVYVGDMYKPSDKIVLDYGLRFSMYNDTYANLEPRVSMNYSLTNTASIKMGYARNTQHLHLMSNSTGGSPTDQWIGNSSIVRPEVADQVSLGFSRNFDHNHYELNTEIYYKSMLHQIDYRDGANINTTPDIEKELLFGKGRAYGWEVIFKKKTGRLTGWVGYTLSKTERQINGINNGEWYNAKQDRTHDLSIVGIYTLNPRWTVSGAFVYTTGNAVTFPTGKYMLNDMVIYQYGTRNADRMPATHRLDINFTYEKRRHSWSFGLYNLYGRRNPYSITFKENKENPDKIDAVQTSLFQWIPAITYNFNF